MKKILFLIITFFVGFKVQALEIKNVYYRKDTGNICDEENKYPIYYMQYNLRHMYFLNLSTEYNLNFEDYYLISFEDSPYTEDIKYFAASDIYSGEKDYNRSIHRLLWERLYPDKKFNMCATYEVERIEKETYYDGVKEKIYSIYEGPTFIKETLYQEENTLYEYEYPYLKYFKIEDSDGLNAVIQNNKLLVSGEIGKYKLVLKRKVSQDGFTDILYTDGTNYLLWYPKVIDKNYEVDIVIGNKTLTLTTQDSDKKILPNICFDINNVNYCSDENGLITLDLLENDVSIKLTNFLEEYEMYEEKIELFQSREHIITLNIKKKDIFEEDKEDIVIVNPIPESKEDIIIEVEDTFYISKILLYILICAVIFLVRFKKM
ncbi:MAG: hypothetical protein IJO63_02800 [Bacilli bacterium]|nr:hypothetical protein [Bacilli bacterium]